MNDFRQPGQEVPLSHYVQEHKNQFENWFDRDRILGLINGFFRREYNLQPVPDAGMRISGWGPDSPQGLTAASYVARDPMLRDRRIPRQWNPGLGSTPNPWGAASGGVKYLDGPGMLVFLPSQPDGQNAVLMKLNIVRQAPLRALAGTNASRPASGGPGSAENVRVPSVSTIGAF